MIIGTSPLVWIPTTRSRVDCGLALTIASFSPITRLRSVDLPALGFPTTVTIPARGISRILVQWGVTSPTAWTRSNRKVVEQGWHQQGRTRKGRNLRETAGSQRELIRPFLGSGRFLSPVLELCDERNWMGGARTKRPRCEGNEGVSQGCRRWPTLPRPLGRSTIGAVGLNDRVRDGNGCGPYALIASEKNEDFQLSVTARPGGAGRRISCTT